MPKLPNRPAPETIKYYLDSGLFWKSDWESCTSCEMWYTFQKMTQDMEIESILNVGLGPAGQASKWNFLLDNIYEAKDYVNIDVVKKYVQQSNLSDNRLINDSIVCDVRKLDEQFIDDAFDFSFWSHGPEHIIRDEWEDTFRRLEKVTNKIVVLQCPWGSYYDYDHEHLSKSISPEEFEAFGYKTLTAGVEHSVDQNILAWKIL